VIAILHFGDVQKIDGSKVPKVDIITFGAPCQDLSVAGKRAGMKSSLNGDEEETRSGLFFEAIRIIKEMREDDRRIGRSGINIRPRFAVYENVTGAFSSGQPKGADFQAVLQELCKVVCKDCPPIPIPKEGWHYAGNLDGVGDDGTPFSISWRTHNACMWGVPQRRRRISVVADFGGTSAPELQFERESVSGNIEESRSEGEGTPEAIEGNIGDAISFQERGGKPGGGKGILIQNEKTGALNVQCGQSVCYGISPYHSDGMKSNNPHSGIYEADTSRTLDPMGGNPACNQGGLAVVSYGVDSHNVSVQEEKTGTMIQAKEDNHSVPCVYGIDRASFNQGKNAKYDISIQEEIAQPLVARGPGGVMTP